VKAVDSPAVRAALSHLRDAEFAGWTVEDEVDGPLLLIETRKNPQLRLEAAILDFVGYWMTRERRDWPKASRGWRQAVRNWMNNAVRFGSWYAVAPAARTGDGRPTTDERRRTRDDSSPRASSPRPSCARPSAEPVACGEIVKSEMAKIKAIMGDAS